MAGRGVGKSVGKATAQFTLQATIRLLKFAYRKGRFAYWKRVKMLSRYAAKEKQRHSLKPCHY